MPSDQTQAIEYGETLECGAFDFSAGDAAAPLKRAPNAFLRKVLARLQIGRIIVQTPSGSRVGYTAAQPGPEATIILHNWRPVRWLLWKGDLGFAESYMEGDWSTPDLTAFLELAARNVENLDAEHARFTSAGLNPNPVKEFFRDGALLAKFFFVTDPDGYKIEVLQKHGRYK